MNDDIIICSDSSGKTSEKYIKKDLLGHGGFAKCYQMVNIKTG